MVDTFSSDNKEELHTTEVHITELRKALRKTIRAQRMALSEQALKTAAASLFPNVMQVMRELQGINKTTPLKRVAGYLSFQGEIEVSMIMDALRTQGVETYAPMLDGEILKFAQWSLHTEYTTNRFGIIEPDVPKQEWIDATQLDVALVPLVAFDSKHNRMGMGGGFYDKTFAVRRDQPAPPWLIGVAHEMQCVDTVYEDWWDVPLDRVVTD